MHFIFDNFNRVRLIINFFITSNNFNNSAMNIFSFVKQYADQINGQFTEYDHTKAIVVVPTTDGRFQTVLLTLEPSKSSSSQIYSNWLNW